MDKGENAGTQHFLIFQQFFPIIWNTFCCLQMLLIWKKSKISSSGNALHSRTDNSWKPEVWHTLLHFYNRLHHSSAILITQDLTVLNPFPNKPWFLRVYSTSLLKTLWEKEKLLVTSNFSFSHSLFYPFKELFFHFLQIWNCRPQTLSVWKSRKFVVRDRVKYWHPCLANFFSSSL